MGRRQYIGARYVPKIFDWDGSSEWRSGVQYEVLTIVTRNGSSYTSKIPVPSNIGAPESNPTYWVATGFKGDTGNGIESIEKTGSSGGVDTYTITMTDGSTSTFTVTNGEDLGAREEIDQLKNALEKNKTKLTKTGNWIPFCERDISSVNFPENVKITKHGRNRFDIENATYTISSYSSSHVVTKENNGIKIVTSFSFDVGSQQVRFNYTAEFTGDLYISCDADCADDSINSLAMGVVLNNNALEQAYGRGKLLIVIPVTSGDNVSVRFYSHINGDLDSTLYYKNIMLAYDGDYPYKEYAADENNETYGYTTVNLPTDKTKYSNESSDTSGLWQVRYDDLTITGLSVPEDSYTVPNAIATGPLSLKTNREVYTNNNGITISLAGKIRLYKDGIGVNDMMTYLSNNPTSLSYITETYYVSPSFNIEEGDSVSFDSSQTIEYYGCVKDFTKKCVCFGDSITGMFSYGTSYPEMITRESTVYAYNVGFSGCEWADHSQNMYKPFCMNRLADAVVNNNFTLQDASDKVNPNSPDYAPLYAEHLTTLKNIDWETVDYVTIFYGTNDWDAGIPMKSEDDTHETDKQHTNEEDAIKYSIQTILTKYPHLKFIVITPYWRSVSSGKDSNVDKKHDVYLFDYAAFIGEIAQNTFNIPVISLYRTLGANATTNRFYTRDGTHPTELTKHIIAERIIKLLSEY